MIYINPFTMSTLEGIIDDIYQPVHHVHTGGNHWRESFTFILNLKSMTSRSELMIHTNHIYHCE